jgi:putative hydrolase of the HAD superfamily
MKFEAVVFDLFGTLVDDFATSVGQTYSELAEALEVPHEQFMPLWRETSEMRSAGTFQTVEASIEHVCGIMSVRVGPEQMAKAVEIRLQQTRRALEPRLNAVTTLARLKNEGYKIGLLSNCSIEIPILWHETAFAGLIDSAIFSSRERLKKPDLRIYQLACKRLDVPPERCLYIADGENYELAAAAKVGLHPVLIRTSLQETRSELRREASEWQGTTISGLAAVLTLVAIEHHLTTSNRS